MLGKYVGTPSINLFVKASRQFFFDRNLRLIAPSRRTQRGACHLVGSLHAGAATAFLIFVGRSQRRFPPGEGGAHAAPAPIGRGAAIDDLASPKAPLSH